MFEDAFPDPWADILPDTQELYPTDTLPLLPPIAGASPGIFEDMTGWFGNLTADSLQPVLDFLAGKVDGLVRAAWAAVEAALNAFAHKFFQITTNVFAFAVPAPILEDFREWDRSARFSAGTWFHASFQVLRWLWNRIRDDGLNWARDRMLEALGFAAGGALSLAHFLDDRFTNAMGWIATNFVNALGYAASGVSSLAHFIDNRLGAIQTWLRDRVVDALGFAAAGAASLAHFIDNRLGTVQGWLRDRVVDALGYVAAGVPSLAHFIDNRLGAVQGWLRDRVVDALGFAARGFTDFASFMDDKFSGVATWINDTVIQPVLDEIKKVPGALIAGAQDIAGFFEEGFRRVFLGPVDQMVETVNFKLAIPGKLIRGEYKDLTGFVDDLVDPAPAILAAFVGPIILALVISFTTAALMTILLQPLAEPHRQEIEAGVGAQLIPISDVQEAWNRDFLTESEARDQLNRRGLSGRALEATEKLRTRLPPLTDLIRFAVREVFDPGQRSALTLDADYPGDLTPLARALGLDESQARNYWAAHWDLPSATQGFEMFWRGVISGDQLSDLLRALDFAPVWRPRLQEIAYNVPTRIDVRRLYKIGIFDRAQVLRAHLDRGYRPDIAEALTEYVVRSGATMGTTTLDELSDLSIATIRQLYRRHVIDRAAAVDAIVQAGASDSVADVLLRLDDVQLAINPTTDAGTPIRDPTTALIRQAYRERIYTRDEAVRELDLLGWLPNEIDIMLELEDHQLARDLTNAQIDLVRERYIGYSVEPAAARAELDQAGVHPDRQTLLINEWSIERERGRRKLTQAEIFRALDQGFIAEDEAFARLLVLGYNAIDANIIFKLRGVVSPV